MPSCRWGHTLSLISELEAVLIGGQGDKQVFSKDAVWDLDIGKLISHNPHSTMGQRCDNDM